MLPLRLVAVAVATAVTVGAFVPAVVLRFPCCGTEPDIYPRSVRFPKPSTSWISRESICCVRKGRDKECSYEYC